MTTERSALGSLIFALDQKRATKLVALCPNPRDLLEWLQRVIEDELDRELRRDSDESRISAIERNRNYRYHGLTPECRECGSRRVWTTRGRRVMEHGARCSKYPQRTEV